jgi:hypothetical protein
MAQRLLTCPNAAVLEKKIVDKRTARGMSAEDRARAISAPESYRPMSLVPQDRPAGCVPYTGAPVPDGQQKWYRRFEDTG